LTVQNTWNRRAGSGFAYRLARNPIVLFVIAPAALFLIKHRFHPRRVNGKRHSVYWTNLAILGMVSRHDFRLWLEGLPADSK